MTEIKAELKSYRQSPRKVRLVVDQIRGKRVPEALAFLSFTSKRASLPIKKLLESAIANAKNNFKTDAADLVVSKCSVDQGATQWRWMPRARGATAPIRKRTCHVSIELTEASAAGAKQAGGGGKKGSSEAANRKAPKTAKAKKATKAAKK